MKESFQRWSLWWFATMVPQYGQLTTIVERERLRKRGLLSIILLIGFVLPLADFPLAVAVHIGGIELGLLGCFCLISPLALWINHRGFLIRAALFYFILAALLEMLFVIVGTFQIPIFSICLWPLLLISLITIGFFLPAWGPLLLSVMLILFYCWFVLVGCERQIAIYIADPYTRDFMLVFICVTTLIVAIFCAMATAVANKAIIRADRTTELEQAHRNLSYSKEQLEEALARIQKQALSDALTGLPNHRAVMDQLTKELEQARRSGRSFSLLFFDADRFKYVNDTYGHAAGDAVLYQIGERAGSILRSRDMLGRFGGEEFVVLLPEADVQEARTIAERIRVAVANGPMARGEIAGGIDVTVSIGLATHRLDGDTEQGLLSQADGAMYIAKRMGRNQVCTPEDVRSVEAEPSLLAFLRQEEQREMVQR